MLPYAQIYFENDSWIQQENLLTQQIAEHGNRLFEQFFQQLDHLKEKQRYHIKRKIRKIHLLAKGIIY